jgi:hypothetical protein
MLPGRPRRFMRHGLRRLIALLGIKRAHLKLGIRSPVTRTSRMRMPADEKTAKPINYAFR